jgi:HK97 family phage prohead protease
MADNYNKDAQFNIVAGITRTTAASGGNKPIIFGTASNDAEDLSGDIMHLSSLRQLREAFAGGLACFLDHSYRAAEDTFGMTRSAEIVKRGNRHDLDVQIELNEVNPRAVQVFQQIENGIKHGLSIGVLVRDAAYESRGGKKVLVIKDVRALELSVVSIPAAQGDGYGAWVSGARKAAAYVAHGLPASDTEIATFAAAAPADADELTILKFANRLLRVRLALLEQEVAKHEEATHALCQQVDVLMHTPVGRKIGNAAEFSDIANRFPWLAPEIINELAKDAHPTGARA